MSLLKKLNLTGSAYLLIREKDTPAYNLPDQVDEEEKVRRQEMIMFTQAEIDVLNQSKIEGIVKVLVEGRDEIIKSYCSRTYADSMEIDGKVFLNREKLNERRFC